MSCRDDQCRIAALGSRNRCHGWCSSIWGSERHTNTIRRYTKAEGLWVRFSFQFLCDILGWVGLACVVELVVPDETARGRWR
eukprot:1764064-Prymnesium_polylepis.1